MKTRYILALCALLLIAILAGCGGGTDSSALPDYSAALINSHVVTPDILTPDDSSRDTSATFVKFFSDTVNDQSPGRWTTADNSGFKHWTLSSSTYFSSPRAWIMGAGLYNYENDLLQTNSFTVPDQTNFIALSFYARWQITDPGDKCVLTYFPGFGSPIELGTFEGGQNPSYPGWDKYYFPVQSNTTGFDQNCNVAFTVTTDSSINSWGFGVDSVSVYQTQLNPPASVVASNDVPSEVHVTWSHNNAGTLVPTAYEVFRATSEFGIYSSVGGVGYPATELVDSPPDTNTYWYKVKATRSGLPDSAFSNDDDGQAL